MLNKIYRLEKKETLTVSRPVRIYADRNQRARKSLTNQGWDNHVEVPEVHVLHAAELWGEHPHQHLEVFRALGRVTGQITKDGVQEAERTRML